MTTEERLAEMRRRIDDLERARLGHRLERLRAQEASAFAAVRERTETVDELFRQLELDIALATHRLASELADDATSFAAAVEAELSDWDAAIERLQTRIASKPQSARARAEAEIAELRRARFMGGASFAEAEFRKDAWFRESAFDSDVSSSGSFIIPNNTTIVASLNTPLSTRTARDGDRFQMTVDAPGQYNGAIIEGRVIGERSGVVTGRANMQLSFETIRLRNGQSYQFAGIVTQVRETDGGLVTVNNEGSIRDSSQTTKTVTRAGIGAVLGAIIGAIAGGGEGAAIGAGVGAGAGAGTVILQGRDNLELEQGTQFTITATAPANVGMN